MTYETNSASALTADQIKQDIAIREKAGYFVPQEMIDFALGRPTAASRAILDSIKDSVKPPTAARLAAARLADPGLQARVAAKRAARLAC